MKFIALQCEQRNLIIRRIFNIFFFPSPFFFVERINCIAQNLLSNNCFFLFFLRRDQCGLIEKGVVIYFFIGKVNCVDKFSCKSEFQSIFFFFSSIILKFITYFESDKLEFKKNKIVRRMHSTILSFTPY